MTLQQNDDERWRAVLSRDIQLDPSFVFAVRSTGIYCRPSCPARRPRRDQVLFFPVPDDAERAGFRPCRRCKPRESDGRSAVIKRICEYIDANPESGITLETLGEHVNLNPHHLQRIFKQ